MDNMIRLLKLAITMVGVVSIIGSFSFIFFMVFSFIDETPKTLFNKLLDHYIPVGGKFEIIELDKFKTFSGKKNDKYYFTVLMKNPPENADSLKAVMVQYFYAKAQYIKTVDSKSYLGLVNFYKYTRNTAYFINNDDNGLRDRGTIIGRISAREMCNNDSTKYEDLIYIYSDRRWHRETAKGLYSECDNMLMTPEEGSDGQQSNGP